MYDSVCTGMFPYVSMATLHVTRRPIVIADAFGAGDSDFRWPSRPWQRGSMDTKYGRCPMDPLGHLFQEPLRRLLLERNIHQKDATKTQGLLAIAQISLSCSTRIMSMFHHIPSYIIFLNLASDNG